MFHLPSRFRNPSALAIKNKSYRGDIRGYLNEGRVLLGKGRHETGSTGFLSFFRATSFENSKKPPAQQQLSDEALTTSPSFPVDFRHSRGPAMTVVLACMCMFLGFCPLGVCATIDRNRFPNQLSVNASGGMRKEDNGVRSWASRVVSVADLHGDLGKAKVGTLLDSTPFAVHFVVPQCIFENLSYFLYIHVRACCARPN